MARRALTAVPGGQRGPRADEGPAIIDWGVLLRHVNSCGFCMNYYFNASSVTQHRRLPPIASHRSPQNHTPLRLTRSRAHTRRIVDEHEASRHLGLTFPVLVRHPDKHPVFQSHPRACVIIALPSTSSHHRRYQVCRRFASWTSDRPLCALGWPCAIRAAASAGCAHQLY
jgi:hypothetical protein